MEAAPPKKDEPEPTLFDLFWERRDRLREIVHEAIRQNTLGGLQSADEIDQMIESFLPVVAQALSGHGESLGRFYVEGFLPPLLARGSGLLELLKTTVYTMVLFASEILALLPPERREEGTQFLSGLYARLLSDSVSVAAREGY